jgi:hypothetical protein
VLDGLVAEARAWARSCAEHLSVLAPYGEFVRGVLRLSALGYFALALGRSPRGRRALVLERDRA